MRIYDSFFLFFCSKIKFEGNTMDRIQFFDQLVAFNEPANKRLVWKQFITISIFDFGKCPTAYSLIHITWTTYHFISIHTRLLKHRIKEIGCLSSINLSEYFPF